MQNLITFITNENNLAIIGFVLFSISECLALIPSVKANGIFHFFKVMIDKLHEKYPKA